MLQSLERDTRHASFIILLIVALWAIGAYGLAPFVWRHFEHQRGLAGLTMVTYTRAGVPGDPINVGLVGSKEDVLCAMNSAGWYPADPVTLRSSIEIVGSVLLDRPYRDAPVSTLMFQNKHEDLAFEKPVGKSADRRHHVRFWVALDHGEEGRAVWLGAITFDRGVGISHDDGRITHHIAPDVDSERDLLTDDLEAAKVVTTIYEVTGTGPILNGRNGEGDPYFTDGEIKISVLVEGCNQHSATVSQLANPPLIDLKNDVWSVAARLLLPQTAAPPANQGN
jgi:hypothetical protein